MTDMTAFIQKPGYAGVAPIYTPSTAADKFAAGPGTRWLLHYKNGATPTGAVKVTDAVTAIPPGSTASAGFADVQVSAAIGASSESMTIIDANRFRDGNGFVNMTNVTPTTLSVCIVGPL